MTMFRTKAIGTPIHSTNTRIYSTGAISTSLAVKEIDCDLYDHKKNNQRGKYLNQLSHDGIHISLPNVRHQVSLAGGAGQSQRWGVKALGLLCSSQALCLNVESR